jgi:hypothetical protein
VRARAYAYANGDAPNPPAGYQLITPIERYGVEAVTGCKTIAVRLYRDMLMAHNIIEAYKQRQAAESWAEWTFDNPDSSEMLEEARKEAKHG